MNNVDQDQNCSKSYMKTAKKDNKEVEEFKNFEIKLTIWMFK